MANDFDDAIVDGVHKIANHRCKVKGYQTRISKEDVRIVLESASLLIGKIEEQGGGNENRSG